MKFFPKQVWDSLQKSGYQPPTANRQPPTTANRQPPPTANRQVLPTAANRQLPTTNCHQPPSTNRQPPPTDTNRHQLTPTANSQLRTAANRHQAQAPAQAPARGSTIANRQPEPRTHNYLNTLTKGFCSRSMKSGNLCQEAFGWHCSRLPCVQILQTWSTRFCSSPRGSLWSGPLHLDVSNPGGGSRARS